MNLFEGIVLGAVLGFGLAPATALAEATAIVFAAGPDDSNTVQRLVGEFNEAHAGQIEVRWRKMDRNNNVHHDQLVGEFEAGSGSPHVIASDVVWTAEFARKDWVEDVTDRFYDDFERAGFVRPALASATHRLRIWGVPWYTDTSVLYYRKDLLAANGYDAPPRTWDELIEMSKTVMKASGTRHGFAFQGAAYEGGTANAAEFLWGAGAHIMRGDVTVIGLVHNAVVETDHVTIGSDEAAVGFDVARTLIAEGVAPAEVTSFREQEALDLFAAGDAVFLRSWPYVQGVLPTTRLKDEQVGVAALPGISEKHAGQSCLGGWNLMLNARATDEEMDAAWQFIRYLTEAAQQKQQALAAGLLPVIESVYDDPDVVAKVPVAVLANELMGASRVRGRPRSPFYADVSSRIASVFQDVLNGEMTGAEAAEVLDKDLRAIVIRNR